MWLVNRNLTALCLSRHVHCRAFIGKSSGREGSTTHFCVDVCSSHVMCSPLRMAQFGIWKRNRLGESSCNEAQDVLLAIMSTGAAESVPLTVVASCFYTTWRTSITYQNCMRQAAILLWVVQFLIVFLSAVKTQQYCVREGQNHHQVWICESAPYQAGGVFLQYSFYWLYVLCSLCAVESVGQMPLAERRRLQGIGLVSAVMCFVLYGGSLEACSVWCWSAFFLGPSLCAEVYGYTDTVSSIAKEIGVELSEHSKFLATKMRRTSGSGRHHRL